MCRLCEAIDYYLSLCYSIIVKEKGIKMFEWWNSLDAFNKSVMIVNLMWITMFIIGQIYQKIEKIIDKRRK